MPRFGEAARALEDKHLPAVAEHDGPIGRGWNLRRPDVLALRVNGVDTAFSHVRGRLASVGVVNRSLGVGAREQ